MPGISFDRAAAFYDATRGYVPGVAERIRAAIVAYVDATPATRFLEIGVGTGRIALPFILAGDDFTGVDLSEAMMERLRQKLAETPTNQALRFQLLQGDATNLSLPDATFDVAILYHVLHLVSDRKQVVAEIRRVLRPGGVLLIAHDDDEGEDIPPQQVRLEWLHVVQELRGSKALQQTTRWVTDDILIDELHAAGAIVETMVLTPYERPALSVRQMTDLIEARAFSSDWHTPDDVHEEATRRIEQWIARTYADPNEAFPMRGEVSAIVARWI